MHAFTLYAIFFNCTASLSCFFNIFLKLKLTGKFSKVRNPTTSKLPFVNFSLFILGPSHVINLQNILALNSIAFNLSRFICLENLMKHKLILINYSQIIIKKLLKKKSLNLKKILNN